MKVKRLPEAYQDIYIERDLCRYIRKLASILANISDSEMKLKLKEIFLALSGIAVKKFDSLVT